MTRFGPRLTYANVASSLALFVALGGTGYAALQIPRNSVGAKEIRQGAVRSNEIRNRAVLLRDISVDTRKRLRGKRGPAGPSGTTFRAAISSGGAAVLGNATSAAHQGGTNVYSIEFGADVTAELDRVDIGAALMPGARGVAEHRRPSGGDCRSERRPARAGRPRLAAETLSGVDADVPQ